MKDIAKCTWNPVVDAQGYNVYLNGVKHNTDLITGTEYFIGGLEPGVEHQAHATAVYAGIESQASEVAVFTIVELFCSAEALAMNSDLYFMEDTGDFGDLFARKRDQNGGVIDDIQLAIPEGRLDTVRFAGMNKEESELYVVHENSGSVFGFNLTGALVKTYDAVGAGMPKPNGYGSSVARDGRIAVHRNSNDVNTLQVIDSDFALDFNRTFLNLPGDDSNVGVRNAIFDACGNLFAHSIYEIVALDPEYTELYSINRDDLFGTSIFSMAMSEDKLYAFSFRLNDEINVALFDLNDFTHQIIGGITASTDPESQIHSSGSVSEQASTVDSDGNCWFAARVPDFNDTSWIGLGRITPEGESKVWRLYDTGGTSGTPTVRSLYYSYPENNLVISLGATLSIAYPTLVVNIDAQDELTDEIVVQATITPTDRTSGARITPGEHSVLKGVDA